MWFLIGFASTIGFVLTTKKLIEKKQDKISRPLVWKLSTAYVAVFYTLFYLLVERIRQIGNGSDPVIGVITGFMAVNALAAFMFVWELVKGGKDGRESGS